MTSLTTSRFSFFARPARWMGRVWPNRICKHCRAASCEGQAIIETAILIPLLLVLLLNAMNFSIFIYAWVTVNNAARVAAEYKVYNWVVLGANGGPPSYTNVQSVITNDVTTLPGNASVSVQVCSKVNGSASCSPSLSYTPQDDPEPNTYKAWSIDVSYSYTPVFSELSLISSQTIHQQVVMRSMQ
jgi:Flp pilus assembly protein TadG